MSRDGKISAGQLFMLTFMTRLIIMLTVNARLTGGKNLLDLSISAVAYMALNLLLIIPAWILRRRYPNMDVLDAAEYGLGKWGKGIAALYALYFLFMNGYFLSFFQLFMESEINPEVPVWLISAAVLTAACYGAFLGLETIARAGGFIFILICAAMAFLLITLNQELRAENFTPLLYDGPGQAIQGFLLFFSRSTQYSVIPVLLPRTSGKLKLRYVLWNVSIGLFFIIMIVTVCGTLGPLAGMETFPVYTMTSLAQSGPFQRLDAVYTGVWLLGLFLTVALNLYLVCVCLTRIAGKTAGRLSVPVSGILLAVIVPLVLINPQVQEQVFRLEAILPMTAVVGVAVPIVAVWTARRREKRNEK